MLYTDQSHISKIQKEHIYKANLLIRKICTDVVPVAKSLIQNINAQLVVLNVPSAKRKDITRQCAGKDKHMRTAGTPTAHTVECDRLSRPCSCLVAGGMNSCLCRAFVSSPSEHVSPVQLWRPTIMASGHSVQFVGSGTFRLQFGYSGGTSPLGVDAELLGQPKLPSSPWIWSLVLSALLRPLYCANSLLWAQVFSYQPSNEHEDGRPMALKTALWRHYATPTTIATRSLDSHCDISRTTYCRLIGVPAS